MPVKFYNPGFKLKDMLRFDNTANDIKKENMIAHWPLAVDSESFFEVPTEMNLNTPNGEVPVLVRFADNIQRDYKKQAVIRINPKAKDIHDSDNVAVDEEEAKVKGTRLWKEAMLELVREHEKVCIEVRSNGLRPRAADGNVKYALQTLGILDPANDIADVLTRKQDVSEVASMKEELAELRKTVLQLAGKGK